MNRYWTVRQLAWCAGYLLVFYSLRVLSFLVHWPGLIYHQTGRRDTKDTKDIVWPCGNGTAGFLADARTDERAGGLSRL